MNETIPGAVLGGAYLNREAAAEFLGVSRRALEVHAHEGSGPPYRVVMNRALYHRDALVAWVEAHPEVRMSRKERKVSAPASKK